MGFPLLWKTLELLVSGTCVTGMYMKNKGHCSRDCWPLSSKWWRHVAHMHEWRIARNHTALVILTIQLMATNELFRKLNNERSILKQ